MNVSQSITQYQQGGNLRELVAWILMAVFFSVLFIAIIVLTIRAVCLYKKSEKTGQTYEMEENPCYASVTIKQ